MIIDSNYNYNTNSNGNNSLRFDIKNEQFEVNLVDQVSTSIEIEEKTDNESNKNDNTSVKNNNIDNNNDNNDYHRPKSLRFAPNIWKQPAHKCNGQSFVDASERHNV